MITETNSNKSQSSQNCHLVADTTNFTKALQKATDVMNRFTNTVNAIEDYEERPTRFSAPVSAGPRTDFKLASRPFQHYHVKQDFIPHTVTVNRTYIDSLRVREIFWNSAHHRTVILTAN